jgi:hypothetical protein
VRREGVIDICSPGLDLDVAWNSLFPPASLLPPDHIAPLREIKEKKRKEAEEKKKKAPAAAAAKAAAGGKASEKLGKAGGANIKPARISAPGKQSAR